MQDVPVEHIFIGSCTNSRIEDLRAAAGGAAGPHVADGIRQALVVPGSGLVKRQAEAEGLDRIFIEAGFEWREPGCSMCLAHEPGQGAGGRALRLHLQSQFRRPAGPGRAHASRLAGDGGGGGGDRAAGRRAGAGG